MHPVPLEQSKFLLRTKFYVPPIRSTQIARPRLTDLINAGLERSLILVSAPAGYGKTTLVSRWLKETQIPSAWLSLDGGDNDPIRFLQYLLTVSHCRLLQALRTICLACCRESNRLNLKMLSTC